MTSLWHARRPASPPPHQTVPGRADLVVVGAGLTGLTTALLAQRTGRDVVLVEDRFVGAAATGNTTAKLSLLQGTVLSDLEAHHSDDVLAAYVAANRAGQDLVVDLATELGVALQRERAVTYAHTESGLRTLEREHAAATAAGLPVTWCDDVELPFPVAGAVSLDDQVQLDPVELLHALAEAFTAAGGRLLLGVRVTGAALRGTTLRTTVGDLAATDVVLATGATVLDRGAHFTRLVAKRSYALSFRVPDEASVPHGMYLSADAPSRSIRWAPDGDDRLLLIGGNGHEVGRDDATARRVEELVTWTREHWAGATLTHQWSAQDYAAENLLPVVQRLPGGRLHVATGFNKWGMTNGPAAALALVATLKGDADPAWRAPLRRRVPGPRDLVSAALAGNKVGAWMARGWAGALTPNGAGPLAEGEGRVERVGARIVATSLVDGRECAVSGVCPHLGGILRWNAAERSWDCPLHGSRFAADGTRLEGMATRDLDGS